MATYDSADQLYATMQSLFAYLEQRDPAASVPLLRSKLVIQLQTSRPEAVVTVDGREDPVRRHYGPAPVEPTLTIRLDGDTLDEILSGRLSLTKALGQKSVQVKGPIWKSMALADLFRGSQDVYDAARSDASASG